MKKHLKLTLKIILITIGSLLILDGLFLTVYSNFNVGILLTFVLGTMLILFAVLAEKLKGQLFTVLKALFIAGICVVFTFQSFLFIYGLTDTVTGNEDAIIVLGSGIRGERVSKGLKSRLDTAIECYRQNPDVLIIVSGGQGEQETITEALAMERYLIENGIPAASVIKEERATSTSENFKFSKAILDDRFSDGYTVAFVSNDYHIYRASRLAELAGFENTTHAHSGTKWYTAIPSSMREILAVIKLWVFKN
ncbi:MAG: YdcF family protein [Ruminococcaceae bacterium]|nr:YdcF family protein [Oscillospiraceae bacterium]